MGRHGGGGLTLPPLPLRALAAPDPARVSPVPPALRLPAPLRAQGAVSTRKGERWGQGRESPAPTP